MTDFWTTYLNQQAATEQYDFCKRCGCDIELDHNCEPIFRQRCGDMVDGRYEPRSDPTEECNERYDALREDAAMVTAEERKNFEESCAV